MNDHDIADITPTRIRAMQDRANNRDIYHAVSFTDVLKRIAAVCMDYWNTTIYISTPLSKATVAALKARGFEVFLENDSYTDCDGMMCSKIFISWENV